MNTEEHDKNYQKIIARAWADAEFAERLSSDPKGALAEQGIEVPDEFEVKVTHANANELHIIIPPMPEGFGELGDEELEAVSGGGGGALRGPRVRWVPLVAFAALSPLLPALVPRAQQDRPRVPRGPRT